MAPSQSAHLPYLLAALSGALSWVSNRAKFTYKCIYREPKTNQRKQQAVQRLRVRSCAHYNGLNGEVAVLQDMGWKAGPDVLCARGVFPARNVTDSLGMSSRQEHCVLALATVVP